MTTISLYRCGRLTNEISCLYMARFQCFSKLIGGLVGGLMVGDDSSMDGVIDSSSTSCSGAIGADWRVVSLV